MTKSNSDIAYLRQKIEILQQALSNFKAALISSPSQLEQDGAIQRFEYSFELTWKTLKIALNYEGFMEVNSPRSVLKKAIITGWIENEALWMDMLEDRNNTVHTYNFEQAQNLFNLLPGYYKGMERVAEHLHKKYKEN